MFTLYGLLRVFVEKIRPIVADNSFFLCV